MVWRNSLVRSVGVRVSGSEADGAGRDRMRLESNLCGRNLPSTMPIWTLRENRLPAGSYTVSSSQ
eukprot:scaffold48390_cov35-Attheya_sp.AAC.2